MDEDDQTPEPTRPRLADIALLAGVGTATVDRVLHGRPNVRAATRARVEAAIRELSASGGRPRIVAPPPPGMQFRAFLGGRPGFANDILARALRHHARDLGVGLACDFVLRRDAPRLATDLAACAGGGCTGVIVQPVEHPLVHDAIAGLQAAGIPVVAVLSAPQGLAQLGYVGLDNRAAGRLAGQITGLLCRGQGQLACLVTEAYRSHEERESGLRSILRERFPGMELVASVVTDDDPAACRAQTTALLSRHPGLAGVVNLGAGNRGIERALIDAGASGRVAFTAFNLTPMTRLGLISGSVSAVVHQDMGRIARQGLRMLIAAHRGTPPHPDPIPAELILSENLRDSDSILI
ncbi:LacI family DNA-binding transcriptional regulator [Paracoccus sp. (in: a-proteobacteria)]|uniref:LacI family DNA-binding transcriptional regulator n=1 Tax=Paracoccus sp. TaxID=267 RepID=UPI00321F6F40